MNETKVFMSNTSNLNLWEYLHINKFHRKIVRLRAYDAIFIYIVLVRIWSIPFHSYENTILCDVSFTKPKVN